MTDLLGGVGRDAPCPCGSGATYAACCRPLHLGDAHAPTAEALMRSRYSAYAVGDAAYLVRTWHPRRRPDEVVVGDGTEWTGLRIDEVTAGGVDDEEGTVTFCAAWRHGTTPGELRERSRFVRRAGRWTYLDGEDP